MTAAPVATARLTLAVFTALAVDTTVKVREHWGNHQTSDC